MVAFAVEYTMGREKEVFMYRKKEILSDKERLLLSRIYKLDRQIDTYMKNHPKMKTLEIMAKTDFIRRANLLYDEMDKKLIEISLKETKYTNNLVDMNSLLKKKEF